MIPRFNRLQVMLFLFVFMTLLIAGCRKSIPSTDNNTSNIDALSRLSAPEDFDWKTSRTVSLRVTGLDVLAGTKNTLRVSDTLGTTVFHAVRLDMGDNYQTELLLPADLASFRISFGSISKTVSVNAQQLEFNYIQ